MGSGEWLGRECNAEVTADAELENGNENFTSTDFKQSKVFLLVLSKKAGPATVVQERQVSVLYWRCGLEFGPQNRPFDIMFIPTFIH